MNMRNLSAAAAALLVAGALTACSDNDAAETTETMPADTMSAPAPADPMTPATPMDPNAPADGMTPAPVNDPAVMDPNATSPATDNTPPAP